MYRGVINKEVYLYVKWLVISWMIMFVLFGLAIWLERVMDGPASL